MADPLHCSGAEPILDDTGEYWAKGEETRSVIAELQYDRNNGMFQTFRVYPNRPTASIASQVNDMLRLKLEGLGEQLVEARDHCRSLEHNEKARQQREAEQLSTLESLGEHCPITL